MSRGERARYSIPIYTDGIFYLFNFYKCHCLKDLLQMSCLVADIICWNSKFNLTSFVEELHGISSYLFKSLIFKLGKLFKLMPPEQIPLPTHVISERILSKSRVLYFPIPESIVTSNEERKKKQEGPLHIIWNHRWEWDKGPNLFFESLYEVEKSGLPFVVSVIGNFIISFYFMFYLILICFC